MTSEERIEQIFEISGVEYTIVEETNELDEKEYGGYYSVVLKVRQDKASAFIAKVEEHYSIPEETEVYKDLINGKDLGEGDTFYVKFDGPQRRIEGKPSPKTCYFYIICSKKITGEYEIKMEYLE